MVRDRSGIPLCCMSFHAAFLRRYAHRCAYRPCPGWAHEDNGLAMGDGVFFSFNVLVGLPLDRAPPGRPEKDTNSALTPVLLRLTSAIGPVRRHRHRRAVFAIVEPGPADDCDPRVGGTCL